MFPGIAADVIVVRGIQGSRCVGVAAVSVPACVAVCVWMRVPVSVVAFSLAGIEAGVSGNWLRVSSEPGVAQNEWRAGGELSGHIAGRHQHLHGDRHACKSPQEAAQCEACCSVQLHYVKRVINDRTTEGASCKGSSRLLLSKV